MVTLIQGIMLTYMKCLNFLQPQLYQCPYEVFSIALEHVDDGYLYHGIAAGLQTHGSTGHIYQHLTREGGIVDTHVELQTLVLGLTAHSLAHQVDTMSHVAHVINTLYLKDMSLIVGKIGVCLDGLGHLFEIGTLFEFHVYHAAVYALAQWYGH